MLLNCGIGEDSWESLGLQGDPASPSWRRSVLNIHWKDWCWSWNSRTSATWWEELTLEKTLMLGKTEGGRRGQQRMSWLDGITDSMDMSLGKLREFGDGQGGLVCCSPWRHKESDTTEWLNWTALKPNISNYIKSKWYKSLNKRQKLATDFKNCAQKLAGSDWEKSKPQKVTYYRSPFT